MAPSGDGAMAPSGDAAVVRRQAAKWVRRAAGTGAPDVTRPYRRARPPSSASMAASRSSGEMSSFSTGSDAASSSAEMSCRPKMFWSVGIRSSTSSSAGSGSGARDSDLIRSLSSLARRHRLPRDLAQRHDRVLVVVAIDRQFLAPAQVARTLRGEQHQLEPVGNFLNAIFDGDARHTADLRSSRVE